jgi:hypothetical protein
MYLDESGDHSLRVVDPAYPVFVLAGVVIDEAYEKRVVRPELDELKQAFFGHARVVLHTSDLIRNRNGFERMKDPAFRGRFLDALNEAMRRWSYTVVACAVRKDHHARKYGTSAIDPYMLSLEVVVERFCYELRQHGIVGADITAEARGQPLDRILERSWQDVLATGTRYVGRHELADRVRRLELRTKMAGEAGLELADLVVSPIGRHVIGKPPREDWAIVFEKLRRRGGAWRGPGLVVLPR